MAASRVIFDGKAFVPQQPVSPPRKCEALVPIEQSDPAAQAQFDAAVRAYYQGGADAEDDAWGDALAPQSGRAWDED